MSVKCNGLEVRLAHVVGPVRKRLETVVNDNEEARLGGGARKPRPASSAVAVVVELMRGRQQLVVEVRGGLVEEAEGGHGAIVAGVTVGL